VNPFKSVTVMELGALRPWAIETVGAKGVSVKVGVGLALTVMAMVVDAVKVPDVPEIVTVAVPIVAVALAVKVSTLVVVVGFVPYATVTPLGRPVAAKVTLPVNPPESVTVMVSVAVLPSVIASVDADGARLKLGTNLTATVSAIFVVAVSVPEVPVMVTVELPAVAVLLAVRVSTLVAVVGLVAKAAVTPLGSPDAASATLPVNPPTSVTVIVSVALLPCETDRVDAEGASVKLGGVLATTVRAMVAVSVIDPEVPVIVTVAGPTVAVLLAVNVITLEAVAGLVPNAAVTPVGNPDAARVTLPENGLTSVIEIVSVAVLPWVTEREEADGVSLKLPVVALPQVFPLTANDVGTALVTPFQVPSKPIPLVLAPGARLPL
jgi:hypothetical protein